MPTSDWAPAVPDVGEVLRARTKDSTGTEVGTFTAGTRPTDVQVRGLIAKAVRDVAMVVGDEIPPSVWEDASDVAATGAAMKVELGYFPEQINTGRSPYPQLKAQYDDALKKLLIAVEKANTGDDTDPGAPMKPVSNFSAYDIDPTIIGRWTRW